MTFGEDNRASALDLVGWLGPGAELLQPAEWRDAAREEMLRMAASYTGDMETNPPWQVLLLGGASGVGKTRVSYRLARHYGAGLTEIDDFQVILEGMTTPEQQPVLHYWRTHPDEARRMDEEQQLVYMLDYSRVIAAALELVIANHLEARTPIVLEGDFLLPSLAAQPSYNGVAAHGQVCAVFLYEDAEEQLRRNYREREGEEQPRRARASWRHSAWLRGEAERLGVPTVAARPWDTVLERIIAAVENRERRLCVINH